MTVWHDATSTHCLLLQKIQIICTFQVPTHLGSPKGLLNGCSYRITWLLFYYFSSCLKVTFWKFLVCFLGAFCQSCTTSCRSTTTSDVGASQSRRCGTCSEVAAVRTSWPVDLPTLCLHCRQAPVTFTRMVHSAQHRRRWLPLHESAVLYWVAIWIGECNYVQFHFSPGFNFDFDFLSTRLTRWMGRASPTFSVEWDVKP